jgi:hypothetical protein
LKSELLWLLLLLLLLYRIIIVNELLVLFLMPVTSHLLLLATPLWDLVLGINLHHLFVHATHLIYVFNVFITCLLSPLRIQLLQLVLPLEIPIKVNQLLPQLANHLDFVN